MRVMTDKNREQRMFHKEYYVFFGAGFKHRLRGAMVARQSSKLKVRGSIPLVV